MGLKERFSERRDATWIHNAATGNSDRSNPPPTLRAEVETCGLCHARCAEFSEAWVPGTWLSDTHVISGIERGLYYADGQMQDEVYNYGSFKQSKMPRHRRNGRASRRSCQAPSAIPADRH